MLLTCLLLTALLHPACGTAEAEYARYVVLGAGPGGLQIAHYLESAGRDYVVLDRATGPGSFFAEFPRWRQLISINKRAVGRADSLAFAERHDWNSLLSDASHSAPSSNASELRSRSPPVSSTDARLDAASTSPRLRFTSWSDAYYPAASDLHAYLTSWTAASSLAGPANTTGLGRTRALRVRYGVDVVRIERPPPGWGDESSRIPPARFLLTLAAGAAPLACTYLIVATGLGEEVPFPGRNGSAAIAAGLVRTYATAAAGDARAYAGQRVLILGHGNGAFEFAHHILPVAAYVHVAGRDSHRLQLALETHYPGAVRAVHASLLETYNLKSLDGITSADFSRLSFARAPGGGVTVRNGAAPCRYDALGRPTSRCSFRRPYDAVIACLGWRFDRRAFAKGVRPRLAPNGKHPAATPRFESVNVPGLFFAGTLAHGADHKRSSGGFIHGFRYTARALHRVLEEEEEEAAAGGVVVGPDGETTGGGVGAQLKGSPPRPWPATRVRGLRALTALLLRRANSGAGLYQMFGALADVLVLEPPHPADVAGFVAAGPHAAMHTPWSHYDAGAAAAAAAGMDPTGLAADVAAGQAPPPKRAPPRPAGVLASEAAIDAALAGGLREEVPVGMVPAAVRRWAAAGERPAASAPPSPPVEWLALTLEFGPSPPAGQKDPFALDRANVDLDAPEHSHFIHPVLRYYSTASPGCSGGGTGNGDTDACAPVATLHIVEDFLSEWRLFSPHTLPLARFLQHVGARRAAAALMPASRPQQPPPPWPLPVPRPPLVFGVLGRLMLACRDVHLFWGGVGFGGVGAGADEGWLSHLSIDAEASLALLRALAVHAADATPGVPLTQRELRCTEAALREAQGRRGSTARAGDDVDEDDGDCDAADVSAELRRSLSPAAAAATGAARSEWAAHYGPLTARTPGLAVLVAEARSGACSAAVAALGISLGGVRLFTAGAGPDYRSGSDAGTGSAVLQRDAQEPENGGSTATGTGSASGRTASGTGTGRVVDVSLDSPLASAGDASPHILRAFRVAEAAATGRPGAT